MTISEIVATTDSGVIGKDGGRPWNIPGDMKFFQDITRGHNLIYGRETFEKDLGGTPLGGRGNIVLSSLLEDKLKDQGFEMQKSDEGNYFLIPVHLKKSDKTVNRKLYVAQTPEEAYNIAKNNPSEKIDNSEILIGGGSKVYETFLNGGEGLPRADRIYLTQIHDQGKIEGDTYFSGVNWSAWEESSREGPFKDEKGSGEKYSFITFDKTAYNHLP